MKGRQYAIFLLVWTFVACMITYYIVTRFEGSGHGKDIAYFIIILLVIYPAVKCLKHLSADVEENILKHLYRLIKQGKYDEAKKILKLNQLHLSDQDFVSELKERLDVGSQPIPAQRAKAKAQQGTKEVTKWYYRGWFIVLMLFLFAPAGITLMWLQKPKGRVLGNTSIRVLLTALWLGLILLCQMNNR